MALADKDHIDFDKLERELNSAVEEDKKYWQKNDAKFRAVEQKVGTYEEFRDIVQAAHLRPLEKDDKFKDEKFQQQWNISASKTKDKIKLDGKEIAKNDGNTPKNGHEFARDWKRYYKTEEEKLNFLLSLGGSTIKDIFKAEISMGLLGELISVLTNFKDEYICVVVDILEALTTANRFQLSLNFLSKQEVDKCKQLFESLLERRKCSELLTIERLDSLQKVYCK